MLFRNDGKGESNIIQNRFTAYLSAAVQRKKVAFLQKQSRIAHFEVSANLLGDVPWSKELCIDSSTDETPHLELMALELALGKLNQRERYILIGRLLDGRDYAELAKELGLGYKGVTAAYYRALEKLRQELRGEEK